MRLDAKSLRTYCRMIRRPWPGTKYLTVVEVTRPKVAPWLVFFAKAGGELRIERRRLQPAPVAWMELNDRELIALYGQAERVSRPHSGAQLRELERQCGSQPPPDVASGVSVADWDEQLTTVRAEQEIAVKELSKVRAELRFLSLLLEREGAAHELSREAARPM
jgi:hypothetical protein